PVRLRALYDDKLLFSPVPYLTKGFPYLRIDPEKLAAKGVDFETAATAQGFMQHGIRGHAQARFLRRRHAVRRAHGERAPGSRISNMGSFASLGWSALRPQSRQRFIPPRSWPIPRSSWKTMTRPCITSRRNSS